MADVILTTIINIVTAVCSGSANYLLDLQENKEALNDAMVGLKATRDDVKRRVDEQENNPDQERTSGVDNWLQGVRTIDKKVVEVIQKADQEIEGRCFGANCPINYWSAHKIGNLVIQELEIVKEHKREGDLFLNNDKEIAYKLSLPSVQEEPAKTTVGMESMLDKVWRLLFQDKVRIMGLYGYGGVGKTTLLKQINNAFLKPTTTTTSSSSSSSNNTHGFDVVILVEVSKKKDIVAIQKEIGDRLGLPSPDRRSIFKALTKKSFVLLLDDIWDRVDLESIGVPPPSENNKSKVVFTTRLEDVCGQMEANEMFKVECLPWNEAWSLFQEKVGERALNSFPRARKLAKDVAKKCGGLPLALITIGRAMAAKKTLQEWNHAITAITTLQRYASEFPGMVDIDGVLPILKVSYDNLRNDMIKSCFLYCALFPEDHSIEISKLIDYWIGEGFISLSEFNKLDDARNKGYGVIGDLKGASLLESGEDDEETEVKMHDMIRDLALWIAPGETEEVRRPPSPLKSIPSGLSVLPQDFFEFTPLLRVLDLSLGNMETFPKCITELLELRYLSLHARGWGIKELPEELGKLVKLNYLDLSDMMCLHKIPSGVIGSLLELRVLNLFGSYADWDFDELYKLERLNDLRITINTQHNLNKLLSNQNLKMCTRHLNLRLRFDQLGEDKHQSTSTSVITLEKLLQVLFNLEKLLLDSFPEADQLMNMGIEQQHHLGSSCFQKLTQIEIRNCNGLKDLTWVGYVPNLETLDVVRCKEIVVIVVVDDLGGSTAAGGGGGGDELISPVEEIFKSLKILRLWGLPKLKSICRNALAFPCLKSMVVNRCPELKKLPFDSGSNLNNTLRSIDGEPRWWSRLQWEEEEELLKSTFLPYFSGKELLNSKFNLLSDSFEMKDYMKRTGQSGFNFMIE